MKTAKEMAEIALQSESLSNEINEMLEKIEEEAKNGRRFIEASPSKSCHTSLLALGYDVITIRGRDANGCPSFTSKITW